MADERDRARETYKHEALELLEDLEAATLELEDNHGDMGLVGRIFRAMHTIKGSGAMFGYASIAEFTHELETVYDEIRNGRMQVSMELTELTLKAKDHIRKLVDDIDGDHKVHEAAGEEILRGLRALMPAGDASSPICEITGMRSAEASPAAELRTYRIFFRPQPEMLLRGYNPTLVLDELKALGHCEIKADIKNIPELEELTPEHCYIAWNILLATTHGIEDIKSVFIFIEDDAEISIEEVGQDEGEPPADDEQMRLGEILVRRGDITKEALEEVLYSKKRLGQMLIDKGLIDCGKLDNALKEQEKQKSKNREKIEREELSTIRVSSGKLDGLVNLVGELVTMQARLKQATSGWDNLDFMADNSEIISGLMHDNCAALTELVGIAEAVERLTNNIRENAMSLRMMPVGSTFGRFRRLVRDLSRDLGKDVVLETDGAATELDKSVIEKLGDPLVHILRNAVDHGIEPPEIRTASGKPAQGTIRLSAEHMGESVLIHISDDGKGIDPARVRAKAIAQGLIPDNAALSDNEAYKLLFLAGFSTAEKVSEVSGRGVGMDVVKRNIAEIRGSIDIKSAIGKGTTVTLRIPLTLAIIDGLIVRVSDSHYIVPLSLVEECVELAETEIRQPHGRHLVNIRGHMVPYVMLRELFSADGDAPAIQQIVIVKMGDEKVGYVVDDIVGEQQIVLKSLGKMYSQAQGVSGATIMGDGTVALMLDLQGLYSLGHDSLGHDSLQHTR